MTDTTVENTETESAERIVPRLKTRYREEILPDEPRGYYAEYTVPTPGSDDRGARRIVAGEGGELYWTDDHYRSFSSIAR